MVVANVSLGLPFATPLSFATQFIIHCVLLFFLLLGILASRHSADKTEEVYEQETANRKGLNEMKNAMRNLKDKINETGDLPENFTNRINALEESLRFISPANDHEAHGLENSFVEIINETGFAISDYSMNEERIEGNLKKLEQIYKNRKQIYSN